MSLARYERLYLGQSAPTEQQRADDDALGAEAVYLAIKSGVCMTCGGIDVCTTDCRGYLPLSRMSCRWETASSGKGNRQGLSSFLRGKLDPRTWPDWVAIAVIGACIFLAGMVAPR